MDLRKLDFPIVAVMELTPTMELYGLEIGKVEPNSVTFDRGEIALDVVYDRLSYEIGLYVGLPAKPDRTFSMSELLLLYSHPLARSYRDFAAATSDSLVAGLKRLASLMYDLFESGLRINDENLQKLAFQKRALSAEMERDTRRTNARRRASMAWDKKNYAGFINWLCSISDDLSESERGKVGYAKKKLGLL